MADEGTPNQQHREVAPARAAVRVEFVPAEKMPDGCRVVPLEVDGALVWGVLEHEMTEGLRAEFNELLDYIVGCGLWRQHWADSETPPGHPH